MTKVALIWQVAFPNGDQDLCGSGGWPGSASGGHTGGWYLKQVSTPAAETPLPAELYQPLFVAGWPESPVFL